jgi:hypothetical protein
VQEAAICSEVLQSQREAATLGDAEERTMPEKTMDRECEAPLDELDVWIEEEDDESYPVGAAIPTSVTISISLPPPPP